MVGLTALVAACAAVTGVAAAPSLQNVTDSGLGKRQNITPNQEGNHGGYFYSWWSDGASPVTYTNLAGGAYSVDWQSGGNLVGGKGWNPGSARSISYQATWEPVNNGNSYLTVYGWTRSPLVEYYIVEAHGEYNPCNSGGAQARGSVTHAGSSYQLCESTRTQQPSIDGTQTFQQYWAIRQNHRTSGTVDTGVFFNAWAQAGMPLGNHYYMVLATEAYRSAGRSHVEILADGSSPAPQPEPTQNPGGGGGGGGGGNCSARWGQCGGQGWNGPTCCASGSTCQAQNSYYSQCL